jgi:hypothetical protein
MDIFELVEGSSNIHPYRDESKTSRKNSLVNFFGEVLIRQGVEK